MFKKRIDKKRPHKNQSALITFGPGSKVGSAHFEGNTIHSNRSFIGNEGEIKNLTFKNNKQHFVAESGPNKKDQSAPGSRILNLLKTITVGVLITVVGGLILYYWFGIGDSSNVNTGIPDAVTSEPTNNSTTTSMFDDGCEIVVDNGTFINNGTAIANEGDSKICVRNNTEFIDNDVGIRTR